MTASDVLNKAADLIERDGWWDGAESLGEDDKRQCAISAIGEIEFINGRESDACRVLMRHLRIVDIAEWNDIQPDGRTVIAALRAAAQKAS